MRKLYPTGKDSIRELNQVNQNFKFDEETYRQLLAQIEELRQELAADKIDLDTFKHNIEQAVTTITVTSENVRTNILNATTAVLTHLTATDITAPDASITRLIADAITGDTAAIRSLTSTDATLTNATISNLNATEATIGELHTTTFNPASVSTTDLTVTNATITNETVDKSTINEATITNADINKAEVVELKADEADILEAEIKQIYSEKLNVKYVTHKEQYNRQEVTTASTSADGDYWIVLPKFLNGSFNIIAKSDTNEILWSMEVMNSTRNIAFRWSVNNDYNFLKDVDLVLDNESYQEFIQIHANTNGLATFLYYRADSYDTEVTPTIWAIKKYEATDPLKHFEFNRAAGTWLPNSVFAGEFHADSMIIDETVFERITLNHDFNLPTAYDQYGNPINYTKGTPGQYITPTLDEQENTGIQWRDPIDNRTPTDAQETIDLISQATLGNYTGKMVAEKITEEITEYADILTDATQSIKVVDTFYPITDKRQVPAFREEYNAASLTQEEAETLIASGLYLKEDPSTYVQVESINVEDKIINGNDYSADWDNLKLYSREIPAHDQIYFNGDWTTVEYPFNVWVSNGVEYNIVHTGDGTEVHGDATIDNDLDVKRDTHIERDAAIDRNTTIGGDFTVATSYTDPDTSVTRLNKVRLPNIYNGENAPAMPDGSLEIELPASGSTIIKRIKDIEDAGVVTKRKDEIAAYKSDSDKLVDAKDGQPMVWRNNTRTIEPADELTLDDLEVDDLKVNNNAEVVNDLKVGADVMIGGDLHVAGKAYIDDVIEQQTEGNFLTLRANSQTAMTPQELSGVLINNTDGQGNIVAIVTDKDGVARVGDVTGTKTTYADLYFVTADNKYYTDEAHTTEVTPQGSLIKWDTKEKTEDGWHWTNAIFVVISSLNPALEPLATRKEAADMNDQGLVKWNATGKKLDTMPLPTINGQKLVATVTPDPLDPSAGPTITYGWGGTQEPSTFIFDTVEDYETALLIPEGQAGYIPSKSHIIIRGNYDNVLGV